MLHLDTDAQRISPFQLKWDQQQLVLSHSCTGWAVETSNGGADVWEISGRVSPDQPEQGTETSIDRARSARGSQGLTRIEQSTLARGMRSDDTPVRIVTLTVPTLSSVDSLLTESSPPEDPYPVLLRPNSTPKLEPDPAPSSCPRWLQAGTGHGRPERAPGRC
jgi:hypothetical protein